MLSLPPLMTMPVIKFSVRGLAFFNTFIMTVNTWWNCLSLSWCSGSAVRWLCPHFFSNQFSLCYTTLQVMKIFTLIPINVSPPPQQCTRTFATFQLSTNTHLRTISQLVKKTKFQMSYLNNEADTAADTSLPWVPPRMGNLQVAGLSATIDNPSTLWQMQHATASKEKSSALNS